METHEVIEHAHRAQEATEGGERFGRRAAVLVSVLAALLAIASLAGNRASTEAILAQQKASDAYNEYQANSLKRHVNEDLAAQVRILAAGGPNESQATQQARDLELAVQQKYRPNQDALLPKAQQLEHDRDESEQRHQVLQMAEAALQLGIVLASIAIVARSVPLVWAGGGLGVVGLLLVVNGFLALVPVPAAAH